MRALFLVYFLSRWVSRTPFFRFPVPFGAVFSGSQAQRERRGVTYSVYFVLQMCLALHTVYISCCERVWRYIQCIFCVADVFDVTYSVYFMLRMCLALHTVYILYCRCVWRYIQCIFCIADVFSVTYSVYFVSSVGLKEKTDVSVRRTRWRKHRMPFEGCSKAV